MHLTRASEELFNRDPDERFEDLSSLSSFCSQKRENGKDHWVQPSELGPIGDGSLKIGFDDKSFEMNDWSFSQLCKLAGVSKQTVNRVSPDTAQRIFDETLPRGGDKPMQILTDRGKARSIHGAAYTRLWDTDLMSIAQEFATDFQPPQKGFNGATGLYAGEQDMFLFMIDPNGWTEIEGEAFAPGFFLWNSEVGSRSVGIETFWFQAVCANHIVWDATEVETVSRKHTTNVADSLTEIRRILANLVAKRDERKDGFYKVIKAAMAQNVEATEALNLIQKKGITRKLAKQAIELAQQQGRFTIFSVVDALTRLTRDMNAGDRVVLDQKSASILSFVQPSMVL